MSTSSRRKTVSYRYYYGTDVINHPHDKTNKAHQHYVQLVHLRIFVFLERKENMLGSSLLKNSRVGGTHRLSGRHFSLIIFIFI